MLCAEWSLCLPARKITLFAVVAVFACNARKMTLFAEVFFTVVSLFTQKVDLNHLCVFVEEGSSKAKDHSL